MKRLKWLWPWLSYSEVNSNHSLKVGSFEVVGGVADDVEEDGMINSQMFL